MEGFASEHFWLALLLALIFFYVVTYFAYRSNYFTFPHKAEFQPIGFMHLAGAFGTFIIVTLVFYPIMVLLVGRIPLSKPTLEGGLGGWIQLLYMLLLFVCIYGYLFTLKKDVRRSIFFDGVQEKSKIFGVGIGMGIISWIVSYPTVLLVNLITGRIGELFWGKSELEQVAVKHLKGLSEHNWLYTLTIFCIVFLVPMVEELLFRGFLQTWFRRFLGRVTALLLTSLIFAVVHFAPSQGSANFELICSLFALSCFLGFIYERQQTLWAPIALHATFNGITVFFLSIQHYLPGS